MSTIIKKITSGILFLLLSANVLAVCANYDEYGPSTDYPWKSHSDDENPRIVLSYLLHFQLGFTDQPLNNQRLYYSLISLGDNQPIIPKTLIRGSVDEDLFSQDFMITRNGSSLSSSKYFRLIVWGIDYQGHQVAFSADLSVKLKDLTLNKLDQKLNNKKVYGLGGSMSVSASTAKNLGLSMTISPNTAFGMAGCSKWGCSTYLGNRCFLIGNYIKPAVTINISGRISHSKSAYVDSQDMSLKTINYKFKGDYLSQSDG